MATYYVRENGTASKSDARVGGDDAYAMSVQVFSVNSFSSGDVIIFEDNEPFTQQLVFDIGGSEGNPVVYMGPSATSKASVDVSATSGTAGIVITGDYIEVRNFQVTSNQANCFSVTDNSGTAGDGYTVHIYDSVALANNGGGDGFSITYGATGLGDLECTRCETRAIYGSGDQGFTHHQEQRMILNQCSSTSATQLPLAPTGSIMTINGGVFESGGNMSDTIFVDGGATLVANDATFIAQGTGTSSGVFSLGSGEQNSITFNNCAVTQSSSAIGQNILRGSPGSSFSMHGGVLNIDTTSSKFIHILEGGISVVIDDVDINMLTVGQHLISSIANADVIVKNSLIDYTNSILTAHSFFHSSDVDSTTSYQVINNTVQEATSMSFIQISANTNDSFSVTANTFKNITGSEALFENNFQAGDIGSLYVANNQFDNVVDVLAGEINTILINNTYTNGTLQESIEDTSPVVIPNPDLSLIVMLISFYLIVRRYSR